MKFIFNEHIYIANRDEVKSQLYLFDANLILSDKGLFSQIAELNRTRIDKATCSIEDLTEMSTDTKDVVKKSFDNLINKGYLFIDKNNTNKMPD